MKNSRAHISKRLVDGLIDRGCEYKIWDDQLKGFGVRVRAGGNRAFVFQYKWGRETRRLALGQYGALTPNEARVLAKKAAAAVARGEDPAFEKVERRRALTITEACERFLHEYSAPRKKASSHRNDQLLARLHVIPELGRIRLPELERKDVGRLVASMSATPYQANRTRAFLSKLIEWAREVGEVAESAPNPVRMVKPYHEEKRQALLDSDQLAALGEGLRTAEADPAKSSAVQIIRALLLTGARLNEIRTLRWSQVDLHHSRLALADSKTGPRDIILGASARAFFERLNRPDLGDAWVFPSPWKHDVPVGEVRSVWYQVRATAGLPATLRLHDLRHVHASLAVSAGFSLYITGRLLGHRDQATTQRYSHIADEAARAAADSVSGGIARALAGEAKRRLAIGDVVTLPASQRGDHVIGE